MDIKIKNIKLVSDNFHARFSVKNKTYIYIISFDKNDDKRYYLYQKSLNIKSMKKCAKLFEGTHNFQNFVSGQRDSYISTILYNPVFNPATACAIFSICASILDTVLFISSGSSEYQ